MAATGTKTNKKSTLDEPARKSDASSLVKKPASRSTSKEIAAPPNSPAAPTAESSKTAPRSTATSLNTPQSNTSLSNNKTGDKIADRIPRSAVSKATEVATKSSKSAAAQGVDGLLSEAQLLKMNDKDYMSEAQLAFFKARLQQLEKDLLKNAGETTEHLRETVLVPDPADRATIEEEHALELRTRDRERKLLKKVQQSIASIDGGDYGWCEETGEPIGIPRLLARPTATLSLEAQQRRELKQKLYGD